MKINRRTNRDIIIIIIIINREGLFVNFFFKNKKSVYCNLNLKKKIREKNLIFYFSKCVVK